jgi:hypothetical protein
MKIFRGIAPDAGMDSVQQGARAVIHSAIAILKNRTDWVISELDCDDEDRDWLATWACNLEVEVAQTCLDAGQVEADGKPAIQFVYLGIVLLVCAAEGQQAGWEQVPDWPLPASRYYAAAVRPLLFAGPQPQKNYVRALIKAVEKLRLKRGTAKEVRSWLAETLAEGQLATANWPAAPASSLPAQAAAVLTAPTSRSFFRSQPEAERASDDLAFASIDDIFRELEVWPGVTTVEQAACAILDRAQTAGVLPGPWSLAELGPTDYDYSWLRVWIKKLDPRTVTYCQSMYRQFVWQGQTYPLQAALGLLLLFWIAESARRAAEEGCLWRWVPQDALEKSARRLLFVQGQPSATLKDLLEVAARRFQLRHVFGQAGMQQWIDSVFLQFGFTRRGFERRLPEWLAGQAPTVAIQQLRDTEISSRTFQSLWETLQNYRQNRITRERTLSHLQRSAWILPEWCERLLARATEPTTSGAMPAKDGAGAVEHDPSETFLGEPQLRWLPPQAPRFECELIDLPALGLSEDRYDVAVNGEVQTQLLRKADGSYVTAAGVAHIQIALGRARAEVALIGRSGQVAATAELELWPATEEVTVYSLSTGQRLADAYTNPMNRNTAYAVLTAPDLDMQPQPAHCLAQPNLKLNYLAAGWSASTRVYLEGDVLWEPFLPAKGPAVRPAWMQQVSMAVELPPGNSSLLRWGDKVYLKVIHPADVTVHFARHQGKPLEFMVQSETRTQIGPVTLTPEDGSAGVDLQVGLKQGTQRTVARFTAPATIVGLARLKEGAWKSLHDRFVLKAATARQGRFKIGPPQKWDKQARRLSDWALMEGDLWLRKVSPHCVPIGEVTALGAPLTLRLGPYNSKEIAMTLAQAVIDRGLIEQAEFKQGLLKLQFSQSLPVSSQQRILYWATDGQVREFGLTEQADISSDSPEQQDSLDRWNCSLPADFPPFLAVGVSFKGWRIGAGWQRDWSKHLAQQAQANPARVAMLLRWFWLPLLDQSVLPKVREVAQQYPVAFLSAWLQEEEQEQFKLPAMTEGWLAAVRLIFQEWQPEAACAAQLIEALGKNAEAEDEFERAVWRLLKLDPLMLFRVVRAWLSSQSDPERARARVQRLRFQIAEAQDEGQYAKKRETLLTECAHEWDVDSHFFDKGHGKGVIQRAIASMWGERLEARDELNLALAMGSESLRRLLAMSLLKTIN